MAVDLSTDPGGLFRRFGKLEDWRQKIVLNQTEATTELDDILDQYNGGRDLAVGLQEQSELFEAQIGAPLTTIKSVARKTMLEMVEADDPLPAGEKTPEGALKRLVVQMAAAADSVDGTTITVGAVTAGGSNVGNGIFLIDKEDLDGNVMESMRTETLVFKCIADGQPSGGATDGEEVFSVQGENAISSTTDPDWPGGSGISRSLRLTSAGVDGSSTPGRNMLTNTNWETWS